MFRDEKACIGQGIVESCVNSISGLKIAIIATILIILVVQSIMTTEKAYIIPAVHLVRNLFCTDDNSVLLYVNYYFLPQNSLSAFNNVTTKCPYILTLF